MLCSCSLHLPLTPAFLSSGICFSQTSCLPLLLPSLCSQIWHPSACTVSSSLSLQTSGFSLCPLFCHSLLLCSSALSATLQAKKNKQTDASQSDVLKCSASQEEVTPCKKRHFKKSSGSSKFSIVIGLNSSQIKSHFKYCLWLNMWHNLEQCFNSDTKFWMLDYWSSWIHFHA